METFLELVRNAIHHLRDEIIWKPGKASPHLQKRILRGHLPEDATLMDYEAIIEQISHRPDAKVFVYRFGEHLYPTILATLEDTPWIVMMDENGILETSFPPDDPITYFNNSSFTYLGTLEEVLS